MFGSSTLIFFLSASSLLYIAANVLAHSDDIRPLEFIILTTIPVWSGWIAGNAFFFASHSSAGKKSAKNIFTILDMKS
jgi:hypothetical protein